MSGDTGNDPAAFKSSSGLLWGRREIGDHLVATALLHLLCQTSARAYFILMNCLQTQAKTKKPRMIQTSWRFQIPANEAALPGMFSEWSWSPGTDSQLLTDSHTVATAAQRGSKATLRQLLRTFFCSHGLTSIYVQSQISVLDPHLLSLPHSSALKKPDFCHASHGFKSSSCHCHHAAFVPTLVVHSVIFLLSVVIVIHSVLRMNTQPLLQPSTLKYCSFSLLMTVEKLTSYWTTTTLSSLTPSPLHSCCYLAWWTMPTKVPIPKSIHNCMDNLGHLSSFPPKAKPLILFLRQLFYLIFG